MENISIRILTSLLVSLAVFSTVFAASPQIQVSSSAVNMESGKTGYLTLTLSNEGTGTAYNTNIAVPGISAELNSAKLCSTCQLYSTSRNLCVQFPSDCYDTLGTIQAGDMKTYVIPVQIPENTPSDFYNLEATIRYSTTSDDTGSYSYTSYTAVFEVEEVEEENITIVNFDVFLKSVSENSDGETTVKVVVANTGNTDAESVSIKLVNDDLVLSSVDEDFIGELTAGDYDTASFTFQPKQPMNSVDLFFEITYTDEDGEIITKDKTKTVTLSEDSVATIITNFNPANFSENSNFNRPGSFMMWESGSVNWTGLIIGVVFIVGILGGTAVFFIVRKRRKEKMKKEK